MYVHQLARVQTSSLHHRKLVTLAKRVLKGQSKPGAKPAAGANLDQSSRTDGAGKGVLGPH